MLAMLARRKICAWMFHRSGQFNFRYDYVEFREREYGSSTESSQADEVAEDTASMKIGTGTFMYQAQMLLQRQVPIHHRRNQVDNI